MSLEVNGVWATGVWATTVWANGVWREGAPVAPATTGNMAMTCYETMRVDMAFSPTDIDRDYDA